MDPDATLKALRELAAQTTHGLDSESLSVIAYQQAELFAALDQWLQSGGFLPDAWAQNR
jgi:hypothetical protein